MVMRIPTSEDLGRRLAEPVDLARTVNPRAAGGVVGEAVTLEGRRQVAFDEQQAQDDDRAAVFQARTALNEWELRNIHDANTGAVNRRGINAATVPEELQRSYDQTRGEIAKGLTSERARQAFGELAESRRGQVLDWANRHAVTQRDIYQAEQFQSDLKSSVDRAAAYSGELPKIAAELQVAGERIVAWGESRGWSKEQTQEALRKQASDMHGAVLDTILATDDWQRAEKYLNANSSQMDPRAVLRLSATLRKQADVVEGMKKAQEVVQKLPFVPTEMDRVLGITMMSESGGRRYGPDGKLLTSPAGAKGEMQVMDATNGNPGLGVAPAKDDSPEERARVGRDYMGALVKRYGGDLGKAWAAYNGGLGRVDKAVAEANAEQGQFRGQQPDPDYWLSKMPAETRSYVAKNLKAYDGGAGVPERPSLQDVHAQVRSSMAGQRPERVKVALDESTRMYREALDEIKVRDDAAEATAMRELMQNGGSWAALPAHVRSAVPPKAVDNMMNFGARIAKGDDRTEPSLYLELTDDRKLRSLNDNEFFKLRGKLSEADWQHFAKQRVKPLDGSANPGELNTEAINSTLRTRLMSMGVDSTPKDGSTDAHRLAAMQRYVRDSLIQAQQQAGKKFDDAQTEKHIDQLFTRSTVLRDTFLGFDAGASPKQLLSMKPGDVPSDVRRSLEADFRARGIQPTPADILGAYWKLTGIKRGGTTGGW